MGGPGPPRPDPGGYAPGSQLELTGPRTGDYPAARPTWSQRIGPGGSMMSAACRSARAIRSRGLTFCSSSVSSETSSRNGVRSSTPGSPPVLATRLALAAWAVRRAWSARRPATRPLRRVPSANVTSRPVPGLTGVSGAAPGCVSGAAPGCGSSDTAITSLRDPGRPDVHDGQERSPPRSCLHGDHLSLAVPVVLAAYCSHCHCELFRKPVVLCCTPAIARFRQCSRCPSPCCSAQR